ncbi:E3 ubiquitin-protein ligase rnf213-alpha-like isoform X1 [Oscarella lobularis]|uniref:E3 ubiquitin-protein ligase rnf213-alpha-like isoform X1 n=1 Tax=Oscarella lobularis TaxID=121494 RepID=UPI0033131F15
MPLVHLLSGSIEPFEKPPVLDWESQEWWCLEGLDSRSIFIAPPLESSIFSLTQLDSLLLRNVLFALNLKDLSKWKKYASHIELVTSIVKKMRNQNLTVDCLEMTQMNFLKENLEQLNATTNSSVNENIIDSHLVFDDVKWRATVVVELLQRFSRADSLSTNLSSLLLVLVHLLFAYISILGDKATTNVASISRLTTDLTDEVGKVICGWIRKFKSGGESLDSILMFCDNFLKIEVVDSTLSELLVSVLSAEIDSLLEERGKEVVIVFCQIESLSCHSKLRECVAKFTARALEDVITKDKSLQALLDTVLKKCPGNSPDVLSNRFLKLILSENVPDKKQSNEIWLRSILTWPLWKTYFFENDFSDSDRDILLCISKAKTVVADVVQLLEEDRLSVTHFDTSSKRDTFLEVCCRLDAQTPGNSLRLRHKARVALEKAFKAEKRVLRNFLRLCEELGNVSLNEISEKIGDADEEPVLFTGFKHLQPYIEKLNDLHGSIVFQDLWHEHTSQPLEPVDSLEKLLQSVIRPIFASWKRLYVSIKRGTVTAFDVQRYFGKVFLSKENLEQELKMMLKYIDFESSLSDWLNERIEQILLFGRRHFVCSISKLVRKICEALGAERFTLCPLFTFNEKEPMPSLQDYPPLLKQFLISLNPERIAVLNRLSSESESFLKKIKDVDVEGQTVLQDLCHIWSIVSKYQVLVGDNI